MTTTAAAARRARPRRVGVVVSDKGNKTISVLCRFVVRHPKYGKYIRRHTRIHAHDEQNQARLGDTVEVAFCRPVSKTKCWRLVRVVKEAPVQIGDVQLADVPGVEGSLVEAALTNTGA